MQKRRTIVTHDNTGIQPCHAMPYSQVIPKKDPHQKFAPVPPPRDPHTFSGTVRTETIYVGARVGPSHTIPEVRWQWIAPWVHLAVEPPAETTALSNNLHDLPGLAIDPYQGRLCPARAVLLGRGAVGLERRAWAVGLDSWETGYQGRTVGSWKKEGVYHYLNIPDVIRVVSMYRRYFRSFR